MSAPGRDRALFVAAIAVGLLGWFVPSLVLGVREPFDHPLWLPVIVPLHALALAILGYVGARGAWRWPFVVAGAQLAGSLAARGFDPGNLFPLSLLFFAFLGCAGLVPAYLGAGLRRLVTQRDAAQARAAERADAFARDAGGSASEKES